MRKAKPKTITRSSRAALKDLTLPPVHRSRLSNGLEVFVMKRGPVPLFTARLTFRAGSACDPVDKFGLADFAAQLLRRGAAEMSADQINEAIEFVGGSLGVGASEDSLALELSAPSEQLSPMTQILAKLVSEPSFPADEVGAAKTRVLAQMANDLDDPALVADRALTRALWKTHPYGHDVVGTRPHIASVSRDDVQQFHRQRISPRCGLLVIVGAVDPARAIDAAESFFGKWRGAEWTGPSLSKVPRQHQSSILLVDKPDATQSQVRIGCLSLSKSEPDFISAVVMNQTLGGGFTSRLVNEIRVKRGLSYGVGSHFDSMVGGGTFSISTFTKSETTSEIMDVALNEVAKMRARGPNKVELEAAKNFLAGLYPTTAESNDALAGKLSDIWLNELDTEWIKTYRSRVGAVTLEDAKRAAEQYLFPALPVVTVVGQASAVRNQLAKFGDIQEQPILEFE